MLHSNWPHLLDNQQLWMDMVDIFFLFRSLRDYSRDPENTFPYLKRNLKFIFFSVILDRSANTVFFLSFCCSLPSPPTPLSLDRVIIVTSTGFKICWIIKGFTCHYYVSCIIQRHSPC